MKKVYLIYAKIPADLFSLKIKGFVKHSSEYVYKNNHYIGLYAWTTNKILLAGFTEFREGAKNIYQIKTEKMEKDQFRMFRKAYFHEELQYYKIPSRIGYDEEFLIGYEPSKKDSKEEKEAFFSTDDKSVQVVCTRHEFMTICEYGHDYLLEYFYNCIKADYIGFKSKYIQALDYIGYVDIFNHIHEGISDYDTEDEFYSDRYQSTVYNNSYNLSFYGNSAVDLYENKAVLFINVFYEMIMGYNPKVPIKLVK